MNALSAPAPTDFKRPQTRKKADMKAEIDLNKCSGHARCYQIDPDLFDIDDSGYALNPEVDIPADEEHKAVDAAASCPERAISLH